MSKLPKVCDHCPDAQHVAYSRDALVCVIPVAAIDEPAVVVYNGRAVALQSGSVLWSCLGFSPERVREAVVSWLDDFTARYTQTGTAAVVDHDGDWD
jgi:hypothetical protein